ncbi:uncharacterized protein [Argopecten irradians]|uniref:uncharacterized protein n=1 Tax=Argopecten irradians TaxID=31199 RepID=UPI003719F6EC
MRTINVTLFVVVVALGLSACLGQDDFFDDDDDYYGYPRYAVGGYPAAHGYRMGQYAAPMYLPPPAAAPIAAAGGFGDDDLFGIGNNGFLLLLLLLPFLLRSNGGILG